MNQNLGKTTHYHRDKIGPIPKSNFTMIKCTHFIHLPDIDRTWVYLPIHGEIIFVLCLVAEKWLCENSSTAWNFYPERRRRREHLIHLYLILLSKLDVFWTYESAYCIGQFVKDLSCFTSYNKVTYFKLYICIMLNFKLKTKLKQLYKIKIYTNRMHNSFSLCYGGLPCTNVYMCVWVLPEQSISVSQILHYMGSQ